MPSEVDEIYSTDSDCVDWKESGMHLKILSPLDFGKNARFADFKMGQLIQPGMEDIHVVVKTNKGVYF